MPGAERVVLALAALGEAGEPAALADRPHLVPAARQDLVGIGLVPDIPDQGVAGRIEDAVQSDAELDHPQTCPEMTARRRNRIDHFDAHFVGELLQGRAVEGPEIRWVGDEVEERGFRRLRQGSLPNLSLRAYTDLTVSTIRLYGFFCKETLSDVAAGGGFDGCRECSRIGERHGD